MLYDTLSWETLVTMPESLSLTMLHSLFVKSTEEAEKIAK